MKLVAAIRDARRTSRVRSAQLAVVKRYDPSRFSRSGWRAWLFFGCVWPCSTHSLPLLVPLFTWLGLEQDAILFPVLACVVTVSCGGHTLQMNLLTFHGDTVLRQPSKAGVLLVRVMQAMPHLLFLGICWASGLVQLLPRASSPDPSGVVVVALAVLLIPLLSTLGRLDARLSTGGESTLGPLCALALCWGAAWYVFTGEARQVPDVVIVVLLGVLSIGIAGKVVSSWISQPGCQIRALRTDLAIFPRWAVAIALLVLARAVDPSLVLGPAAWGILGFVVLCLYVTLNRLVDAVGDAEEETGGSPVYRVDSESMAREPETVMVPWPSRHPGRRSPVRAALYLHRRTAMCRRGDLSSVAKILRQLPSLFFCALHHLWGVILAVLAVAMTTETRMHMTLALLAGLTAPAFIVSQPNARLHLLGVDYSDQTWNNLRAILFFAVAPALLAAVVTGTLVEWNTPRLAVLSCIVAAFALRIGWRGFSNVGELESTPNIIILGSLAILIASLFGPHHADSWLLVGLGLVLVIGVIGVVLRLRGFEEAPLAAAVRSIHHDDI